MHSQLSHYLSLYHASAPSQTSSIHFCTLHPYVLGKTLTVFRLHLAVFRSLMAFYRSCFLALWSLVVFCPIPFRKSEVE